MIYFLADLLEKKSSYNTDEILETKWLDIEEIKNMKKEEFRCYPVIQDVIKSLEDKEFYELDIIKNLSEI